MIKYFLMVIGCLALLAGAASTQEVVITDFPLGIAGSVDEKIFEPYLPQIKAIADTLKANPKTQVIVTGGADGQRYNASHDAKNPSLALGRAHTLRALLMNEFGVDSTQILLRTEEFKQIGPQFRYVSAQITRDLSNLEIYVDTCLTHLVARIDTIASRPPVEKHFTEIREVPVEPEQEDLGIQFGAGVTSSPFGAIPVITTAFTYKRVVYVEGIVGHTFWSGDDFLFEGESLSTRRRQIGGHAIIYPFEELSLGFVAGWVRTEEIAPDYLEYAKLSEGPLAGLRFTPVRHLSVTAAYNPSKHRIVTDEKSTSKNGQFLLYFTVHYGIGGAK